jgi:hypothetical protein
MCRAGVFFIRKVEISTIWGICYWENNKKKVFLNFISDFSSFKTH